MNANIYISNAAMLAFYRIHRSMDRHFARDELVFEQFALTLVHMNVSRLPVKPINNTKSYHIAKHCMVLCTHACTEIVEIEFLPFRIIPLHLMRMF